MLQFLKRLWKKNEPEPISPQELLKTLETGSMVRLTFKDPNKFGIKHHGRTTFTRFNPAEVANRTINGTVTRNWIEPAPLNARLLEVCVVKEYGTVRKFLFLDEEIEAIEKL